MRIEIDLLRNYPKTVRDRPPATFFQSTIARKFGKDFFDGHRVYGYGGYHYDPKYWTPVVPDIMSHFNLKPGMSVLDVGCAKGFLMHDLHEAGLEVAGIDISQYAVDNAMEDVKPFIEVGNAVELPFANESFDVVLSINTVHNLERDDCSKALREIRRVCKHGSFITVDAWRTEEERQRMMDWNLTAKTIMSCDEWREFFKDCYAGDYYWFICSTAQ